MDDAAVERERVACVFRLGGGELHEPHPEFPDQWDGIFAHWYEGPPSYATEYKHADEVACLYCEGSGSIDSEECPGCSGRKVVSTSIRTAILYEVYSQVATPPGWERLASFSSSGTADCPWCEAGADADENADEDAAGETCKLCQGDKFVSLAEGAHEVIYRAKVPWLRWVETDDGAQYTYLAGRSADIIPLTDEKAAPVLADATIEGHAFVVRYLSRRYDLTVESVPSVAYGKALVWGMMDNE